MLLKDLLKVLHHDHVRIFVLVHFNNHHSYYKCIYTGSFNYGRFFEFDGPYGSYIVNDIILSYSKANIYISKC